MNLLIFGGKNELLKFLLILVIKSERDLLKYDTMVELLQGIWLEFKLVHFTVPEIIDAVYSLHFNEDLYRIVSENQIAKNFMVQTPPDLIKNLGNYC